MYKGHMDKAKGGMFQGGRKGWVGADRGVKMEKPYLNNSNKKKEFVHLRQNERKKGLLPFTASWMELESITLSEISQMVKDKYHVISSISGT